MSCNHTSEKLCGSLGTSIRQRDGSRIKCEGVTAARKVSKVIIAKEATPSHQLYNHTRSRAGLFALAILGGVAYAHVYASYSEK